MRKHGPDPVTAQPLKDWLLVRGHRGDKKVLAANLTISPAVLTNWLRRGIPEWRLAEVAQQMGTDKDRYLVLAGLKKAPFVETAPARPDTDLRAKLHAEVDLLTLVHVKAALAMIKTWQTKAKKPASQRQKERV